MLKKVLIGSVVLAGSIALVGCSSSNPHFFNRFHRNSHADASHSRSGTHDRNLSRLERNGTKVVRHDDQTKLVMPNKTNFRSGSATVNEDFQRQLNYVAQFLKQHPYTVAEILGNTDNTGSDAVNQALSERRAHAVISYLESRGIPSNRLLPVGLGENHPVASNSSNSGRDANRRVEITLHQEAGSSHNSHGNRATGHDFDHNQRQDNQRHDNQRHNDDRRA